MKTALHISPKSLTVLWCFILSLPSEYVLAQSSTSTASDIDMWYYILGGAILVVFITTFFVIHKLANILGEYGLPLFDFEFPIFKRMAESGRTVAIVMILLVLWGIYVVVTY